MSADALRREALPDPEDASSDKPKTEKTRASGRKRMWVNKEFLRSLTKREPQIVVQDSKTAEENYYVKLADIALRAQEPVEEPKPEVKPKSKGSGA